MNHTQEQELIRMLAADIAWHYKVIPHKLEHQQLTLLVDTSVYHEALANELELITGYEICLIREETDTVQQLLSKLYRKKSQDRTSVRQTATELVEGKTDDFLQKIIREARELKSSDIHIERYTDRCRIRLRIDGKLVERYSIPPEQYASFVNKIKIKGGMDIAEKRLPQDGRIHLVFQQDKLDIRVSVIPTLYGEKIVLRLLNNDASEVTLEKLGFDDRQLSDFSRVLKKPHGIILISGPTGSGKTTTLYATLKLLNNEYSNVLTIEDPIEYTLDGINQVQLKESIGLTFASALRTFLRQDPDIIMLGEIRDGETAQMAIRAALTGHLVLSTIHTNSAWGTVSRLTDMGIPTFLLASTLNMTVAQRLVRKLCPHCKQAATADAHQGAGQLSGVTPGMKHYTPGGCDQCYYTGYSGRVAIYEIIPVDALLSQCIRENMQEITAEIKQRKISTLQDKALELMQLGVTSLDEVYPILLNY